MNKIVEMFKRRKYHIIDTKLKPGYYDKDVIMLHGNFSILVDFVEVECAWINYIISGEKFTKKNYFLSILENFFGFDTDKNFRNPELGIKFLKESCGGCDDDVTCPINKEILFLYDWWKNVRPNRKSPSYEELDSELKFESDGKTLRKPTAKETAVMKKKFLLEKQNKKEDERMLIRLMKVRTSLWT